MTGGEELRNVYLSLGGQDIRRYMRQLLEALAYIHERDIMHRDVKPQNVSWGGGEALQLGPELGTCVFHSFSFMKHWILKFFYFFMKHWILKFSVSDFDLG